MSKNKINMGGLDAMFGDAPKDETPIAATPSVKKAPVTKKVAPAKPAAKKSAPQPGANKQLDYDGSRATYTLSNEVLMAIRMEYASTGKNQSLIVNEILEKHFKIKR